MVRSLRDPQVLLSPNPHKGPGKERPRAPTSPVTFLIKNQWEYFPGTLEVLKGLLFHGDNLLGRNLGGGGPGGHRFRIGFTGL